jgi:hypothetical protein
VVSGIRGCIAGGLSSSCEIRVRNFRPPVVVQMTISKGKRPRDPNQRAKRIVDQSTSEAERQPEAVPAALTQYQTLDSIRDFAFAVLHFFIHPDNLLRLGLPIRTCFFPKNMWAIWPAKLPRN